MTDQDIERLSKAIDFIESQCNEFSRKENRERDATKKALLQRIAQNLFAAKEHLWTAIFAGCKKL